MLELIGRLMRPKSPHIDRIDQVKDKAFWITAVACENLDDRIESRGSFMWTRIARMEQIVTQQNASITVRTVIYDSSANRPESIFFETEIHFTIEDGYFAIPEKSGTFVHHGMSRSGTLSRPYGVVYATLDEPERPKHTPWTPTVVGGAEDI